MQKRLKSNSLIVLQIIFISLSFLSSCSDDATLDITLETKSIYE